MSQVINSNHLLENFEKHIKVIAGPGAGKTHWLALNIKNVLHNSTRLGKTRQIACITHTNTAVETLLSRLETSKDAVLVSTIHSFLYQHVVKPYISFIADEVGFNSSNLQGHDDIKVSRRQVEWWLEQHPNKYKLKHPFSKNQLINLPNNLSALKNWLMTLNFQLDGQNNIYLQHNKSAAYYIDSNNRKYLSAGAITLLQTDLMSFKKSYWSKGRMSHDDVLFFSFKIINKYPFVLDILRSKFPYFYIDEFQDSHPIQIAILKLLAEKETIIGIIGDSAQAIYEFQGADASQLLNFNIDKMHTYIIEDNRRSSNEIVIFLNQLRLDLKQKPLRGYQGEKPLLIVGDVKKCLSYIVDIKGHSNLITLSRDNQTVNYLKELGNSNSPNSNLLERMKSEDKTSKRWITLISYMISIEYSIKNNFKKSLSEIINQIPDQRTALKTIFKLSSQYSSFKNISLLNFIKILKENYNVDIAMPTSGTAKTFYSQILYSDLAICLYLENDNTQHKTIHKSKGEEFDNVLVIEKEIDYLTSFDINNEEHRIRYVAVSRTKDNLFISVPSLDNNLKIAISQRIQILEV